jgi:hypothetical protein
MYVTEDTNFDRRRSPEYFGIKKGFSYYENWKQLFSWLIYLYYLL